MWESAEYLCRFCHRYNSWRWLAEEISATLKVNMESFSGGFVHAIIFFLDSRNSIMKTFSFQSIASLKTTLLTRCHFLFNFSAKCSSVKAT